MRKKQASGGQLGAGNKVEAEASLSREEWLQKCGKMLGVMPFDTKIEVGGISFFYSSEIGSAEDALRKIEKTKTIRFLEEMPEGPQEESIAEA